MDKRQSLEPELNDVCIHLSALLACVKYVNGLCFTLGNYSSFHLNYLETNATEHHWH